MAVMSYSLPCRWQPPFSHLIRSNQGQAASPQKMPIFLGNGVVGDQRSMTGTIVCRLWRDDILTILLMLQYIMSHVTVGDFACCGKSKLRCYKLFLMLLHDTLFICWDGNLFLLQSVKIEYQ